MSDLYQAPQANLEINTARYQGGGSIANGIAGNYEFSIRDIFKEAWEKTKGNKKTIWLSIFFYIVAAMAIEFISVAVLGVLAFSEGSMLATIFGSVLSIILGFLILPMAAGLFMIGIKIAVEKPVDAMEVFAYFGKTLPLVITMIVLYLCILLGFILLVLPGIYLVVAYSLSQPLLIEKNLSFWQALETSRKAITHRWFSVFGLFLLFGLISLASVLTLGILFIWTIPMMMIAMGIIYRNMFGFENNV